MSKKEAYCARLFIDDFTGKGMTLYQKMLIFYAVMAALCALITWFLTTERRRIRLIATFLIGATWPFSFPVALLLSLF